MSREGSPSGPQAKRQNEKRSSNDFIFGKLVGEGSFSSVYLARDVHNKKEYAIKTCEKFLIKKEKKTESVMREKKVMNLLNNSTCSAAPFFVKLSYTFQCEINLYFVMTYCRNGELLKWIKKVGSFDRKVAAFYSAEILRALEHMHTLTIIHRDLKPENILLDDQMHIKITDFGSAKILRDSEEVLQGRRSSFVGTAQYVSPEVLNAQEVSGSTDLWALGCVIYQMISGFPPFNGDREYLIFKKITKLDYGFEDIFDSQARDLVERLLVLESGDRLGATDGQTYTSIRSHGFFEGLDFELLHQQTPPTICEAISETENELWLDSLSPGLSPGTITRLELRDTLTPQKVPKKDVQYYLSLSKEEQLQLLMEQRKNNPFHCYVEDNLILRHGLLEKRKGLFWRRRVFLLTVGPKLYYVDPVAKVVKGQVPFHATTEPDPKDFKLFCLNTPNRIYYLQDPSGSSHEWCQAIDTVREHYFGKPS